MQPLLAVGGYNCALETSEDFDLWWRLCSRGRLANHPEVLLKYRWHGANESIVKHELQLRDMQKIMIDHLLANGSASSPHEGEAYVSFLMRGAGSPASIGRGEITAFSAVSRRLSHFVACSPFFREEDLGEVRRSLRWTLIARARRCSRLSLDRYRLLILSSRLFPEEGGLRRILARRLRRLFAARRTGNGTDGQFRP